VANVSERSAVIEAVVFDADGVIQRRPEGWRANLGAALGFEGDAEGFLAELFAEEIPMLVCGNGISEALTGLMKRWSCAVTIDEALEVWTRIEVEPGVREIVEGLRSQGIHCFLASNQEAFKAEYMSRSLGYGELFDREFYSCHVGCKKPDLAYFEVIAAEARVRPERLLFIDDQEANVIAARQARLVGAHFTRFGGAVELTKLLRAHGLNPPDTLSLY
jgi:putative hydrolase of the HAD superfamily